MRNKKFKSLSQTVIDEKNARHKSDLNNYLRRCESVKKTKTILDEKMNERKKEETNRSKYNPKAIYEKYKKLIEQKKELKRNGNSKKEVERVPYSLNKQYRSSHYINYAIKKHQSSTLPIITKKEEQKEEKIEIKIPVNEDCSVSYKKDDKIVKKQLTFTKNTVVFGVQDCIYQCMSRLLLWYRNPELETYNIPLTSTSKMVEKCINWNEWIKAQMALKDAQSVAVDDTIITKSTYPSWTKWYDTILIKNENSTTKKPTIQTMCQWLFNQFNLGVIVIPKEYIEMLLSIDELLFLEWPFLLAVNNNHIYPIINRKNSLDWISKKSRLLIHYYKNKNFVKINSTDNIYSKVLTDEKNPNYISIKDKKSIIKENIYGFKKHLESLDFLIIPYWNIGSIKTIRRFIFKVMRHPLGQAHPDFWNQFASYTEVLLSFYEKYYSYETD